MIPKDPIVYLAVPYTHKDPAVMQYRSDMVNKVAVELITKRNIIVYSPITMAVPLRAAGDLPTTWEFWKHFDTAFLVRCNKLIVLMLDGWKESIGVQDEIKMSELLGHEIEYIKLEDILPDTHCDISAN